MATKKKAKSEAENMLARALDAGTITVEDLFIFVAKLLEHKAKRAEAAVSKQKGATAKRRRIERWRV